MPASKGTMPAPLREPSRQAAIARVGEANGHEDHAGPISSAIPKTFFVSRAEAGVPVRLPFAERQDSAGTYLSCVFERA